MAKPRPSADERALLAEIAEHSGDDTPRLVYADWLDENARSQEDHDRAEFIRLQCHLADCESLSFDSYRFRALEGRQGELLRKHRRRWLEELPAWARRSGNWFYRGFPARIHLVDNVEALARLGKKWKAVPTFTVTFHFESEDVYDDEVDETILREMRELAATPALARVTDLSLWEQGVDDAALSALVASPYLHGLRLLVLYWNRVGTKGFRALAGKHSVNPCAWGSEVATGGGAGR